MSILVPPRCRHSGVQHYSISKDEKANITCEVDAEPPYVRFHWMFNNSSEATQMQRSRFSNEALVSVLSFKPATDRDYGTLSCWGRNSAGTQKEMCSFIIQAAGKVDTVTLGPSSVCVCRCFVC